MKVSMVSEHASPLALIGGVDAGGQNVHVAALAIGLARCGAHVTVHTRRDDPRIARRVAFAPGVVVDHVDAGPAEPLSKDDMYPFMGDFAADLERQWRMDRPDVVHAHFWMSGLAAAQASRTVEVPMALTFHALGLDKRRHQGAQDTSPEGRLAIEEWLARNADRVIATTSEERRNLLALGARGSHVNVVPCGVDLGLFRPDGTSSTRRSKYRVVCASRLVPRKGLLDVVAALAPREDIELVIAGGPPAAMLGDEPHAAEIVALADELGSSERVTLLGAVDRHEMPALLRSADVVCCTPWYEPFGLVAVEAMACGVPVVASAVGGLAETVVPGSTGLLVPPRRPDAIQEAVMTLLDRPALRRTMQAAARRRARSYGWSVVACQTMTVYRRMTIAHRMASAYFPSVVDADLDIAFGGGA